MLGWLAKLNRSAEPEVVVILPEPLATDVRELLRQHRRLDAVKLAREKTRLNLLPAVKAVDALSTEA